MMAVWSTAETAFTAVTGNRLRKQGEFDIIEGGDEMRVQYDKPVKVYEKEIVTKDGLQYEIKRVYELDPEDFKKLAPCVSEKKRIING